MKNVSERRTLYYIPASDITQFCGPIVSIREKNSLPVDMCHCKGLIVQQNDMGIPHRSLSSERILIWCSSGKNAAIFELSASDCRLVEFAYFSFFLTHLELKR